MCLQVVVVNSETASSFQKIMDAAPGQGETLDLLVYF